MVCRKFLILGNELRTTVLFRGSLIKMLIAEGHSVVVATPKGTQADHTWLIEHEVSHIQLVELTRAGMSVRHEMRFLNELCRIFAQVKPYCLYAYSLKLVIWGSFAAKRTGVSRSVGLIEGLGSAFSNSPRSKSEQLRTRGTQIVLLRLLKAAVSKLDATIVLNIDDHERLKNALGPNQHKLRFIDGIGVDLDHFAPVEKKSDSIRFTLAARLIEEKGIYQFAKVAAHVRCRFPSAKFRLLGGIDSGARPLPKEIIQGWKNDGVIEWPGLVEDVRPHLSETSVFVLPSMYSEGLPRSIMEAMSMALPIVTTDVPGCRTSIEHGVSGFVIPAGSSTALEATCLRFLDQPKLIRSMGQAARNEAKRRYSLDSRDREQVAVLIG